MKKKLVLLDLVLLALVVTLGHRVRQRWLEARKREAAVFGQRLKQLPSPPYAALAPVLPVTAAQYNEVAQQMLFSADRNPTVIVEVAPPPPMPKLPVYYGLINLGAGPFAIMSAKPGDENKQVRFGENIGEFKLVSANREQIVLEWRGEKVVKKVAELMARTEEEPVRAVPASPAQPPKQAIANTVAPEKKLGPGVDVGASFRPCQPGDTSPAGTVMEGYRKTERDTPFGKVCQWDLVK
jgi:hypothetical protein